MDTERYYFLSVFIGEDGIFDKYSLDEEGAEDSHSEFKEEREIRKNFMWQVMKISIWTKS